MKGHGISMATEVNEGNSRKSSPSDVMPNWRQLPMRKREEVSENLTGYEIHVGRLAMVGFIGLLVTEIVSGEGFAEQFQDAFIFALDSFNR
jgi:hypothetical protein